MMPATISRDVLLWRNLADEAAVDLDLVERQLVEILEARIARSEIIESDLAAAGRNVSRSLLEVSRSDITAVSVISNSMRCVRDP
jgi:heme oxygenase